MMPLTPLGRKPLLRWNATRTTFHTPVANSSSLRRRRQRRPTTKKFLRKHRFTHSTVCSSCKACRFSIFYSFRGQGKLLKGELVAGGSTSPKTRWVRPCTPLARIISTRTRLCSKKSNVSSWVKCDICLYIDCFSRSRLHDLHV